jgi:DNA-binding beta-propeller fold protein YncE
MNSRIVGFLALVLSAAAAARACAQGPRGPEYRVLSRTVLGGEGGWDYLKADPAGNRLFVTRGTHVMVVDLATMRVAGDVPGTTGVHGVALAPALGRGFTSNGRDSSVTIFDLRTLAPLRTVKVTGRNPDSIVYDSASGRVFTMNGGSGSATAIDARTGEVVGTVALGGRPEEAVSDGRGRIFINLEDRNQLEAVDARTLRSVARWELTGCDGPTGIAMDVAHRRLFSTCGGRTMVVSDARRGRVVATVEIGEGPDGAAFDAATQTVFSSNGEGTLTVVHEDAPDRYRVVQTVTTQRGARTLTLDPRTHRVYTVTSEFGPPPPPTADRPRPRPTLVPGTFTLLTVGTR